MSYKCYLHWHCTLHCMSQCKAFITALQCHCIHTTQSEYTYSTVVSAVDISSLVNKVFHYIKIVFLSCQVQGSILLKKERKFNVYNKNLIIILIVVYFNLVA